MAEPIRLHTRDHRTLDGEADVTRYGMGQRLARGGGIALAGLVIGMATIVIPVMHLFLPWMLPIGGLILGVFVGRIATVVPEVRGTCPDCATTFAVRGAALTEDLWIRCPKCTLPLRVEVLQ